MKGFVQIAGVRNPEEARRIVDSGADALGFPFRLDHHAEDLSESEARDIISRLAPSCRPILITYLNKAEEILELARYLGVAGVQLHGGLGPRVGELIKAQAPDLWLIKSLVLRQGNEDSLIEALRNWGGIVDAFLTDTYDLQSGASGATGKVHDWKVSRRLVELSPKPLILAGGLNSTNVAAAIAQVRPWGVDVHTGVEDSLGRKDSRLVQEFVETARRAFALLG